jgi:hypothetical protein
MSAKYLALSLSAGMSIMAPVSPIIFQRTSTRGQTIRRVPLLAAECGTEGERYEETWLWLLCV